MPISLIVYDDFASQKGVEAVAQGDGPARGREPRSPTCWHSSSAPASATRSGSPPTCTTPPRITTIPNRAVFQDFEPFWEFVSGPLHAGSFPQNKLDNTFGPQLMYVKAPSAQPAAERRPAVLRSGRHRRRHPGHDRDAQGRRGPRAVVDQARAEAGVTGAVQPKPCRSTRWRRRGDNTVSASKPTPAGHRDNAT